jgi:hypothetical protein
LRGTALGVIATVCQNNIVTQDLLYSQSFVDKLVIIFNSSESSTVAAKALLAISALLRGHAAAEEQFALHFAVSVFPKAFSHNSSRTLLSRALFLSHALITSPYATEARILALVPHVVPSALELLVNSDVDVRDNAILALSAFLQTTEGWKVITSNAHKANLANHLAALQVELNISDNQHELKALQLLSASMDTLIVRFPQVQPCALEKKKEPSGDSTAPLLLF